MLKATLLLSGAALAASLVFGGGTRHGTLSDVVPELLALPLLVVAGPGGLKALLRQPLLACLFAGVIAVFVLQLVPLPPGIWSVLPGRDTLAQFYTVAGMPLPWQPLSLSPGETWRAGLALLPALTLFLATLTLSRAERQVLLAVAVVIGLISVPLGILQVLGGDESPLYFFQFTNPGSAVGFFANANHYAAFCYMLIPLSAALLSEPPAKRRTVPPLAIFAGVVFAFLLGLVLSRSRSALLLGVLSVARDIRTDFTRPAPPGSHEAHAMGRRHRLPRRSAPDCRSRWASSPSLAGLKWSNLPPTRAGRWQA